MSSFGSALSLLTVNQKRYSPSINNCFTIVEACFMSDNEKKKEKKSTFERFADWVTNGR